MIRTAKRRLVVAGALVLAATATAVGSAGPALAETPASWTKDEPLSTLEVLGVYVAVPVAMFVLIAILVATPSLIRGTGYRPGLSWWAEPQWFGATPGGAAGGRARSDVGARGGAGAQW